MLERRAWLVKSPRGQAAHPPEDTFWIVHLPDSPAIGPYIGGLLTDTVGWQWNFYINFIPGILMFIAVFVAIEKEPLDLKLLKQCDWVGIATMAVGLGSLIAMLEQGQQDDWFGSEFIRTCGALAGVLISVFAVWELFFAKTPLVHLRLLASRNLGLSSLIGFVLGVGLYGTVYPELRS